MTTRRDALRNNQWEQIKDLLLGCQGSIEVTAQNNYCSAIAEKPTIRFSQAGIFGCISRNPNFATAFMAQMAYRSHREKVMVELRSIRFVSERMLHYLRLIVPSEQNTIIFNQSIAEKSGKA